MGLCFGGKTQKCLYRDQTDSSKCLASLYGKQPSCTPARFEVYRYTTKDQQIKELISIQDCKCMWQPDAGNYYFHRKGNTLIYFELQKYVLWLKINIALIIIRFLYIENTQGLQVFERSKFRNLLLEVILFLQKANFLTMNT